MPSLEGPKPLTEAQSRRYNRNIARLRRLRVATRALKAAEIKLEETQFESEAAKIAAVTDKLTGVGNRRGLEMAHEQIVIAHRRQARKSDPEILGSALFVDVDHLKQFNDRHGHAAGDRVLIATAFKMREVMRRDDAIARFGGDEFIALLPGASSQIALEKAETLRQLSEASGVTLSIGVVPIDENLEVFLEAASHTMYEAKKTGRNQVTSAVRT